MQKENRKYYEAYEDRYKTAHEKGVSWEQMKILQSLWILLIDITFILSSHYWKLGVVKAETPPPF